MANDNSGESVLAFLLGGIAGIAAGLLLAPKTGEETREQVGDWLQQGTERARHFIEEHCECGCSGEEKLTADSAGRGPRETAEGASEEDGA